MPGGFHTCKYTSGGYCLFTASLILFALHETAVKQTKQRQALRDCAVFIGDRQDHRVSRKAIDQIGQVPRPHAAKHAGHLPFAAHKACTLTLSSNHSSAKFTRIRSGGDHFSIVSEMCLHRAANEASSSLQDVDLQAHSRSKQQFGCYG